jgi:hypothetical protein
MPDSLRVRGQETQLRVTMNGQIFRTFNSIENFTITYNVSILEKNYIGQTAPNFDEIFMGSSFEFSLDPESSDIFKLADALVERASRRTAQSAARFNLISTYNFPNGQRVRGTLPDVKLGDIPIVNGGRDQYLNVKITGKCESKLLLAGV